MGKVSSGKMSVIDRLLPERPDPHPRTPWLIRISGPGGLRLKSNNIPLDLLEDRLPDDLEDQYHDGHFGSSWKTSWMIGMTSTTSTMIDKG